MVCVAIYAGLLYTHTSIFPNDFINILIWSLSAAAMVGLEKTFYQFSEDSTFTSVCIEVFGSDSDCPVDFAIAVNLTTSDGNAGKLLQYIYSSMLTLDPPVPVNLEWYK